MNKVIKRIPGNKGAVIGGNMNGHVGNVKG